MLSATSRHNITPDPEVYAKFVETPLSRASRFQHGSNQQMKEFIEEGEYRLAKRKERMERDID